MIQNGEHRRSLNLEVFSFRNFIVDVNLSMVRKSFEDDPLSEYYIRNGAKNT